MRFKAGDKVRLISFCGSDENYGFKIGEVYTVTKVLPEFRPGYYLDNNTRIIWEEQLEFVSQLKSEGSKFKVGDKVQRIGDTSQTYTVTGVPGMEEYDNRGFAAALEGMTLEGYRWDFQKDYELVYELVKEIPKFKVGDRVYEKHNKGSENWQGTVIALEGPRIRIRFDKGMGSDEQGLLFLSKEFELIEPKVEKGEIWNVYGFPMLNWKDNYQEDLLRYYSLMYKSNKFNKPKKGFLMQKLEELSNAIQRLLNPRMQKFYKVGWLDSELDFTEAGEDAKHDLFNAAILNGEDLTIKALGDALEAKADTLIAEATKNCK